MSQLPSSVHAVVIGAGIHGLSTGWHLGLELGAAAALRDRRPPLVGAP